MLRTFNSTLLFLALVLLATSASLAADPVGPFGLGINLSRLADTEKALAPANPTDIGINKYIGGTMLECGGDGLGIEGLKSVLAIHDPSGLLRAVILNMGKHRFDAVFSHLSKKYDLVRKEIPFVGDRSAEFKAGNVLITIEAPHMSFDMTAMYIDQATFKDFKAQSTTEKNKKNQRESSQF